MYRVDVVRIPVKGPGDVSGLEHLLDTGQLDARDIVAVLGKTEGNGCVNDFTREYATHAYATVLARHLGQSPREVENRVAFVMSGGTEGVLSPHVTVFARSAVTVAPSTGRKRLSIGVAFTRDFAPHELGRLAQVQATADAVHQAMRDAGIEEAADVHFVQIKCPLLTSAKVSRALAAGREPVTHDTYESMGFSRGASALGVAVALGEVTPEGLGDDAVLGDWSRYSSVASTSAGIELDHNVVIVMGMSERADGPLAIAHDVMTDAIDTSGLLRALRTLQLSPGPEVADRVVNVFAKAEASPHGHVRGMRHTMLDDSDINSTRHARSVVGAVIASVVGHGMVYVSGGAEHQGPAGGGPVAVIARV